MATIKVFSIIATPFLLILLINYLKRTTTPKSFADEEWYCEYFGIGCKGCDVCNNGPQFCPCDCGRCGPQCGCTKNNTCEC